MIALRWLQARKVEVSGAVSVVGFDSVPESAGAVPP